MIIRIKSGLYQTCLCACEWVCLCVNTMTHSPSNISFASLQEICCLRWIHVNIQSSVVAQRQYSGQQTKVLFTSPPNTEYNNNTVLSFTERKAIMFTTGVHVTQISRWYKSDANVLWSRSIGRLRALHDVSLWSPPHVYHLMINIVFPLSCINRGNNSWRLNG